MENSQKPIPVAAAYFVIICIMMPQLYATDSDLERLDHTTFASQPQPQRNDNKNVIVPGGNNTDEINICPDFRVDQVPGTVVKCFCKGDEIFINGKCQHYEGNIVLPVAEDWIYTVEVNATNYNITVRDVSCNPDSYLSFNFSKGQFHWRNRGDIVLLKDAGELEGQRINKYCLIHHLDKWGDLTWTMKSCVPIPSIPRCCPYGYAMKEGECQEAKTPHLLTPPVLTNSNGGSVSWPNMKNYLNKLTCNSDPINTIPLSYKKSGLISLANGVNTNWSPDGRRSVYYSCPEFCVDGIENPEGSVDYFTSFCYQDPRKAYENACKKGPCFHKCCKHGYSMDVNRYLCLPDVNSSFSPPVATNLSNYNIVIGYPLCDSIVNLEGKIAIDRNGRLSLGDKKYPSGDFCIDTFRENDLRKLDVLVCPDKPGLWIRVRTFLFPICKSISMVFLSITIACHIFIPALMANGGYYLMCYTSSLLIAFATGFIVNVFHDLLGDSSCVNLAIAMQFGFLATFFWLNIMCFDVWRKIRLDYFIYLYRNLAHQKVTKYYSNGLYLLYGWGTPLCICIITALMQNLAPDNVWGVVKPYIGVSRCWFKEDIGTLLYFYGPISILSTCSLVLIVFTFINYNKLLLNFMKMTEDQRNSEEGARTNNKRSSPKPLPSNITNPIQDSSTKLKLFALMVFCWITEVLSWKIPPIEIWALTDTLNALQGLFIFIIFLLNKNKRTLVEKRFPLPFRLARGCQKLMNKLTGKQNSTTKSSQEAETSVDSTSSIDLTVASTTQPRLDLSEN